MWSRFPKTEMVVWSGFGGISRNWQLSSPVYLLESLLGERLGAPSLVKGVWHDIVTVVIDNPFVNEPCYLLGYWVTVFQLWLVVSDSRFGACLECHTKSPMNTNEPLQAINRSKCFQTSWARLWNWTTYQSEQFQLPSLKNHSLNFLRNLT